MGLVDRALARGWHRIAFIGASKHAGKTTAMNRAIREAVSGSRRHPDALPLGLCSIGLDGERMDTVLGVPKPAVVAPTGTLVASAEQALMQSEAVLEWLEVLNISSPLGPVAIVRVLEEGAVTLAGVRQRAHVRRVLERLSDHGARLCLVDGAFDRAAAAIPGLVDAAVLAVSPVIGRTPAQVAEAVAPLIQRFALPPLDGAVRAALAGVRERGEIGVWRAGGAVQTWPRHALVLPSITRPGASSGELAGGVPGRDGRSPEVHDRDGYFVEGRGWPADARVVYVPGAVTDRVMTALMALAGAHGGEVGAHGEPGTVCLVADHPVHVFASARALRDWYAAGHEVRVWTELPLLAIAANPHHILGWDLPRAEFLAALRAVAGDVPVIDANA
ncbi:hypothetical protein [Alicyclobacillus sp.]|uniref:lysine 5,6-aminomutase reactivase subunit KamB n=1 Tax=Alicyclobacillus sp. TaxID=61169 RepID=UPI0025C5CA62|nr:hypothetical protein [Alicyclobacillus sp.]MCL6518071.1 hypothetical protein [Alicyclobacillus sp.]